MRVGGARNFDSGAVEKIAPRRQKVDRFYSRFPAGSVGLALVFLRLADGFGLASEAWRLFTPLPTGSEPTSAVLLGLALVAGAILLILGLRTTLAGSAAAVCTAASAFYGTDHLILSGSEIAMWFFLFALVFVLSSSLALTGPGAYSLDARLSGWRRIRLPSPKSTGQNQWETWS
jgi:uncharacterized membrane protein YphA (DoxX/SURF4 family)